MLVGCVQVLSTYSSYGFSESLGYLGSLIYTFASNRYIFLSLLTIGFEQPDFSHPWLHSDNAL